MKTTCPECQKSFSVSSQHAGKRAKCPKCNASFVIARASSEKAERAMAPPRPDFLKPAAKPPAVPKKRVAAEIVPPVVAEALPYNEPVKEPAPPQPRAEPRPPVQINNQIVNETAPATVIVTQQSQVLPALASFFIPGLGQLIQGRPLVAMLWFFGAMFALLTMFILIGFVLYPMAILLCIIEAAVYKPPIYQTRL